MIPALALLFVFVPVASWGNDLYALPKMAVVCAVVAWEVWRGSFDLRPYHQRHWFVFAAALLVSTFFSWDLGYSLVSIAHSRGLGLLEWGVCGLLFLYGCNVAGPYEVEPALAYGAGALAVWAVVERLVVAPHVRAGATQGGPVALAEVLAVCYPFARRRLGTTAASLILGAAAGAAGSRALVVAAVIQVSYLYYKESL